MNKTFEVEKFGRGGDGKWFGFGARRFASLEQAQAYFVRFTEDQHEVLSHGIRIDLRERVGRKVLVSVGGK